MKISGFIAVLAILQMVATGAAALVITPDTSWTKYSTNPSSPQASVSQTTRDSIAVVRFPCDISLLDPGNTYQRCYWHRAYAPAESLAGANAVRVKVYVDNPDPLHEVTLMLSLPSTALDGSGNPLMGWFGMSRPVKSGWQVLTFPLADLNANNPARPLGAVSTLSEVQLSAVRRAPGTWTPHPTLGSAIRLDVASIELVSIPVAVIASDDGETNTATTAALQRYDIDYLLLNKSRLVASATNALHRLYGTAIVLATNVNLSVAQADFLSDHFETDSTARFIGFGPHALFQSDLVTAKGQLADTLGITLPDSGYVANVNGIVFDSGSQSSMSLPAEMPAIYDGVYTAEYTATGGASATVPFATWKGTPAGVPALFSNSVAVYADKVWLPHYHAKESDHLLLALMLKLRPDMAQYFYERALAGADRIGNHPSFGQAVTAIRNAVNGFPAGQPKSDALDQIALAETRHAQAVTHGSTGAFAAIAKSIEARQLLGDVYAQVKHPTDPGELKAFWSHSGLGAYPGDWNETLTEAANAGFTHIISNNARGANVVYPSVHMCTGSRPTTSTTPPLLCFEKDPTWHASSLSNADPLALGIAAAHDKGLKFVLWKWSFAWGYGSVDRAWWESSVYAQRDYLGNAIAAPSPCSSDMRDMDYNVIDEIASDYLVDGIQLDFIRFFDEGASFDTHCRTGFADHLANNADPGDDALLTSCAVSSEATWRARTSSRSDGRVPACVDAFRAYQKKLITDHVARIRGRLDVINGSRPSHKPAIELWASVYPTGGEHVGQDWPAWLAESGPTLLDRVLPMTYAPSLAEFQAKVDAATDRALNTAGTGTRKPMHFGIDGRMNWGDSWVAQLDWLRTGYRFPAPGFSLFNMTADAVENLVPRIAPAVRFRDDDEDGVHDDADNCPLIWNEPQTDTNSDGIGDACEPGLFGEYFDYRDTTPHEFATSPVFTRVDATIDFYWDWGSPDTSVVADEFSVRWTGYLVPPVSGTYEFCVKADDGTTLWIEDEIPLLDFWVPQSGVLNCATKTLTADEPVPMRLDYFEDFAHALIHMYWSYPGQEREIVPAEYLFHHY